MTGRGRVTPLWLWGIAVLGALALLLRFVMLDARPVMHDESLFAYYAYLYFQRGDYTHLPVLHGPTLMLATGKLFALFGDSIAVARAFIAAASLAMLGAALALVPRRYRLLFAPLLITSPVLLYYSRFLRNDILFAAVLMLGTAGFALALSRRRRPAVRAAGAALGMFMLVALTAIMENAVFVYATGATFLLLLAAMRYRSRRRRRHGDAALRPGEGDAIDRRHGNAALRPGEGDAIDRRHGNAALQSSGNGGSRSAIPCRRNRWLVGAGWTAGLALGLAYLAFVYGLALGPSYQTAARLAVAGDAPEIRQAIALKTLELSRTRQAEVTARLMADSWRNVGESWDYWMGQHKEHRISGPSHYYLPILLTYELPMCLLLLAGLALDASLRRRRAALYGAAIAAWVALWLAWRIASPEFAPAWLGDLERFLHLAPDASALTLGLVITPVLVWSLLCLREHRVLAAWMGWWLACSLFQYSVAGEKVPWLAIHVVLPLYLTVAWLWAPKLRKMAPVRARLHPRAGISDRGSTSGRSRAGTVAIGMVAPVIVAGASLLALRNDIALIGSRAADPVERLIYNHTTPWLQRVLQGRVAEWESVQDKIPLAQRRVLLAGHGVWPAVWYLRRVQFQLADGNQRIVGVPEGTDLIVGEPDQVAPLREGPQAARYLALEGSLRDAWIETWPVQAGSPPPPADRASPGKGGSGTLASSMEKLWRYYWWREPWTPRSAFPIVVLVPAPARR